jgi:hypothetical protein
VVSINRTNTLNMSYNLPNIYISKALLQHITAYLYVLFTLYPAPHFFSWHCLNCPLSAPSWVQSPMNSASSSLPVCRYMTRSAFAGRLPLKAPFPLFMGKCCTFYNGVRSQCLSTFTCRLYVDFLTLSSLYSAGMPGRELGVPIGAERVLSVRI